MRSSGYDESSCDPLAQRARAEVDQADLVRAVQQLVRERLADVDAGECQDAVVQALEVLEVDRGPHLDAVGAQVLDVLVALAPRCTGRVRVRQLVHAGDRRASLDDPVDVRLRRSPTSGAVLDARGHLDPSSPLLGAGPSVRLEVPDHEVDPLLDRQSRIPEHLVGLADARGGSEVDAQLPAREPRHVHEASLESRSDGPCVFTCVLYVA